MSRRYFTTSKGDMTRYHIAMPGTEIALCNKSYVARHNPGGSNTFSELPGYDWAYVCPKCAEKIDNQTGGKNND